MPSGPMPVEQTKPPSAPDLPETMADNLDMTPRGHANEDDREELATGANKKIRVCAPQDQSDVESLVTGLPKDLLLLVLSRVDVSSDVSPGSIFLSIKGFEE